MPSNRRSLSVAETAKLLRTALKDTHPGVKFSVRSHSYSGGASVRVGWTDGPTQREVEATAQRYKGASFDGMTDMMSYHDTLLSTEDGAELVSFGADFVSCSRTISPEFTATLANEIATFTGQPYEHARNYHVITLSERRETPAELYNSHHERTRGSDILHQLAWTRPRPTAPAAA